jgi:hypothetical protein
MKVTIRLTLHTDFALRVLIQVGLHEGMLMAIYGTECGNLAFNWKKIFTFL